MAVDVIEELLSGERMLLSPDQATATLSRWTAEGYATAARECYQRIATDKDIERKAVPKLAAVLLRSAQSNAGQMWLQQQASAKDGSTNADIILRGCLDGNNVPIVRRAAAAALARLVRFTDDERDHNGIVFAYARGLLPLLVQLTVSPDEEVASQAQLGTAFVLQMSASMGREIGGLVGAGAAVADALAFIAQPANDLSSQLTSDERCRGWKVCARMADVDNAVGQMLGARTIQALVDAVRRTANDATDAGDGLAIGALEVLREVAESAKSCAAAAANIGVAESLQTILGPAFVRPAAYPLRAAALQAAAAYVAFGITEELQAPLLMALESALDTATADDKTDAAYVAGALAAVQTLCATQEGASACCSQIGTRAAALAFAPTAKSAHQKAALGALAALLTCGNGLPEEQLRVVWGSIGQASKRPGEAVAQLLSRGQHVEHAWRVVEAASLYAWAIAELLQAEEFQQAIVRGYGLDDDADESRRQALQNMAHVISTGAGSASGEHGRLVEEIKRAL